MTRRILIVDDQPEIRELILLSLKDLDAEFFEAADAEAALALVQSALPHLVLLDVNLRGPLDGFEVCRRIKASHGLEATCVVIVSTRAQTTDVAKGAQAEADYYLTKPFSPAELHHLVSQALLPSP